MSKAAKSKAPPSGDTLKQLADQVRRRALPLDVKAPVYDEIADALDALAAAQAQAEASIPRKAVETLRDEMLAEGAAKDSFHATMGIGYKAAAARLDRLLAPVAPAQEEDK